MKSVGRVLVALTTTWSSSLLECVERRTYSTSVDQLLGVWFQPWRVMKRMASMPRSEW